MIRRGAWRARTPLRPLARGRRDATRSGRYGWSGGQGTNFYVDPDGTVGILLTQVEMGAHLAGMVDEFLSNRRGDVASINAALSREDFEAIRVLDNGVRMAASDPRRDGWALAY